MAHPTTPHLLVVLFLAFLRVCCFQVWIQLRFFPPCMFGVAPQLQYFYICRYPFICKYIVGVARVGCELRRIVCFRFGVAFSPWSAVLGAVRVLWDAPLSTIRSMTLEPAQEGIKVALSAPVEYSADHQARGSRSIYLCPCNAFRGSVFDVLFSELCKLLSRERGCWGANLEQLC